VDTNVSIDERYCESCKDVLGLRTMAGYDDEFIKGVAAALLWSYPDADKRELMTRGMAILKGCCNPAFLAKHLTRPAPAPIVGA